MKELQELYLINNTLTGVIPEEIGGLDKLVALYMNRNKLIGPLPRVFKLKSLTALSLNKNALTGMIPGELFTANIKSIDLSDNHFQGSIPPAIGRSLNLTYLNVANNNLSGSIPSTICKLRFLEFLIYPTTTCRGHFPSMEVLISCFLYKNDNFQGISIRDKIWVRTTNHVLWSRPDSVAGVRAGIRPPTRCEAAVRAWQRCRSRVWRKPGQAKGHQRGVRPLSLPGSIVGVGGGVEQAKAGLGPPTQCEGRV
ncbi:hypothetical protein SASPL_155566 [Salvia splendens]|uniref:LRR receptor-like serine/threonine-protein kinase FLS2 n=1 Tax=Salvia splendens TaxID=180675 RepID=A0A8X8VY91_SALSN|nr:probable leucine-rich repeat receptor-like protein kinase At1g35710 [Salvia splendens]KAG6384610.1 hypothetical protein SASPL_155566 [Salvia splendens]